MRLYDILLAKKLSGGGGGGSAVLINKNISSNGTYNASSDNADGYKKVVVSVPNTYVAGDEGKVVSNGALVAQTAHADVVPTTSDQTIDTTTNNSIKVKGDADLIASNIKKDVEIFGVTGSYEGGGGGISVDDIAQNLQPSGAITLNDSITQIGNYAFAGKPITSVYGKNVTSIGENAFAGSTITGIDDADFPNLGVDSMYVVYLRLPNTCTSIKLSGTRISLSTGSNALRGCKGLVTAEFPNAGLNTTASNKGTGQYCLGECTNLEMADLGFVNYINAACFYGSSKLATIVLRNTSLVPLGNVSAFTNTPFKSGGTGGTIYIPKVLYDHLGDGTANDYQHATNWLTVQGYGTITWAKIEGSIYEL